jgi:transposase
VTDGTPQTPAAQRQRFRPPPWTEASPEWQRCDAQVPPDHVARRIVAAVARLDLGPLFDAYSGRGSAAVPPELLLKVVLIERQRGRPSPAEWCVDLRENLVLQWAGFGIRPARSVCYAFRDRLGPLLERWNQDVVGQAIDGGLTEAAEGAIDGTTLAACASRHRLLNQPQLAGRIEKLKTACDQDGRHEPVDNKGAWMAATPDGRAAQLARYEQAATALQPRLEANARRMPSERLPVQRVVISPSDPEAALGPDKFKTFRPLYNALTVSDLNSPLILAYEVFACSQDTALLEPMLKRTRAFTRGRLQRVVGDSGFITGTNLAHSATAAIDLIGPWKENDFTTPRRPKPAKFTKDAFTWLESEQTYQCPAQHRLEHLGTERRRRAGDQEERLERYGCRAEWCAACPLRSQCTDSQGGRQLRRSEHEPLIEAHRAKMTSPEAKGLLRRRGQTAERGFADLKEHRHLRRLTGRGLARARTDVGLGVLIHNLLALHDHLLSETTTMPAGP